MLICLFALEFLSNHTQRSVTLQKFKALSLLFHCDLIFFAGPQASVLLQWHREQESHKVKTIKQLSLRLS